MRDLRPAVEDVSMSDGYGVSGMRSLGLTWAHTRARRCRAEAHTVAVGNGL